ncbi:MAG: NHLP bacteriocin system secretion protein [Desulfobacteraceae bacterium]|nr:NHLP bacteriocin system secretion protein [Desulfobacteraceae bacterium]
MPDKKKRLFSETALKKLSSPEELDKVMVINSSSTWLALWASLLFILLVVIWGFIGQIPDTVMSQGIIMDASGKQNIPANTSGQIKTLLIGVGDKVKKDQLIATIDQPHLRALIKENEENLQTKTESNHRLLEIAKLDLQRRKNNLREKEHSLNLELLDIKQLLTNKNNLYQKMIEMKSSGGFSEADMTKSLSGITATKARIDGLQRELDSINSEKTSDQLQYENSEKGWEYELKELKHKIATMKQQMLDKVNITAPNDGVIIGLDIKVGNEVTNQTIIAQLSLDNKQHNNEAILNLYVSPFSGNKIQIGQKVHFSPSYVIEQEYGYMMATVIKIDRYPIDKTELFNDLVNEELVNLFLKNAGGPPIRVYCQLERDTETANGYAWSTKKGSPLKIPQGTLGAAKITVAERRPAELVLPWLKKKTGL